MHVYVNEYTHTQHTHTHTEQCWSPSQCFIYLILIYTHLIFIYTHLILTTTPWSRCCKKRKKNPLCRWGNWGRKKEACLLSHSRQGQSWILIQVLWLQGVWTSLPAWLHWVKKSVSCSHLKERLGSHTLTSLQCFPRGGGVAEGRHLFIHLKVRVVSSYFSALNIYHLAVTNYEFFKAAKLSKMVRKYSFSPSFGSLGNLQAKMGLRKGQLCFPNPCLC